VKSITGEHATAEFGSEMLRVVVVGFKLNAAGKPVVLVTAWMGEEEDLEVRELGLLDGLSLRSMACEDGSIDVTLFTLAIPDDDDAA
jgi:hypothetical protein